MPPLAPEPSSHLADRTVTLIAPLTGKPDLYGASFPIEAKPPKPERIVLDGESGASERTSLSIVRAGADNVLGFVEGKRVKIAVLDGALKPRAPTFELPGHEKTTIAKLVALDGGRVLVLTLDAGEIAATTVECPH